MQKNNTNLYNARFVEQVVTVRLVLLHVPEDPAHLNVIRVDQSEGSDVDKVVLEVLEIERFDVLGTNRRDVICRVGRVSARAIYTYKSCEQVVVVVIVHLQRKNLKRI